MTEITVRQARADDADAVADFASDTWEGFDGGDYLPRVFPEWVESDGPDQRTFAAEAAGEVVGVCQCVTLSEHEAWAQGMRVAPAHRGSGVAAVLNEACFDWARDRGATVCRAMVFSWNVAGLGAARGVGFDPATEFRWATPGPASPGDDFEGDADLTVTTEPDAAWSLWRRSDARDHLAGLGLDTGESWALSEVTPERFRRIGDDGGVLAVRDEEGTRAATYRSRVHERETGNENSSETETWVEYGVAAWDDLPAARALFAAIRRDAADLDADRVRVLIPETAGHVSDVAYAGVDVSDEPDFVLEADLTGA